MKKHRIIIRSDWHRERAASLARSAPEGFEVVIQKHRENKTIPQLGYTFGIIYPTIIGFIEDSHGDTFSVEEIHKYMKRQILGVEHKEIDGDIIEVEIELKKSDKDAWSGYIDRLVAYCWNRWGLQIPAPHWKEDPA